MIVSCFRTQSPSKSQSKSSNLMADIEKYKKQIPILQRHNVQLKAEVRALNVQMHRKRRYNVPSLRDVRERIPSFDDRNKEMSDSRLEREISEWASQKLTNAFSKTARLKLVEIKLRVHFIELSLDNDFQGAMIAILRERLR